MRLMIIIILYSRIKSKGENENAGISSIIFSIFRQSADAGGIEDVYPARHGNAGSPHLSRPKRHLTGQSKSITTGAGAAGTGTNAAGASIRRFG